MKKAVVIKISGALLDDEILTQKLFAEIVVLQEKQQPVVLVHGGGNQVDRWLMALKHSVRKHEGLRVTPKEQMDVVAAVLSGLLNKKLVAQAQQQGLKACGLSLMDAQITTAAFHSNTELGHVGVVKANDLSLLQYLLQNGQIPVIASVASCKGVLLNVNADDAASVITSLLQAQRLILLTDVKGVLDQKGHCIPALDHARVQELIKSGIIYGGMIPKVQAALDSAQAAGCPVSIMSFHDIAMLSLFCEGHTIGTTFQSTTSPST